MTIDPMAAVTTLTDAAGPVGADAAQASIADRASIAENPIAATPTVEQTTQVDLVDYMASQNVKPPVIDTLTAAGKANYLAHPANLGDKVLQQMENLHQRALDHQDRLGAGGITSAPADTLPSGPASAQVAAATEPEGMASMDALKQFFDYSNETTMMGTVSNQFTKTVNTLMKGQ